METSSPTIDTNPASKLADVKARYAEFDHLVAGITERPPADAELSSRASMLLFHEARLLDNSHYEAWVAGWADDGLWWVPINTTSPSATEQALALDDLRRLKERTAWMADPAAWSQQPPTRVCRSVSSVEAWLDTPTRLITSSALTITSVRRSDVRVTAARQIHEFTVAIAGAPDGPATMRRKKAILLIDSELGQMNPGYLL